MSGVGTKSQIDRLGAKLRAQAFGEAELRMLDEYRRSFGDAYEVVVEKVQDAIGVQVSGRPAKSTPSIIEKLNRESIRLSQIQDIAGCRVVVDDVQAQDRAIAVLVKAFKDVMVLDRREKPSHGYRAVHVIVREAGKTIEVQVRTAVQQAWAELSEKFADMIDPSVKYGGGPAEIRELLAESSAHVSLTEDLERTIGRAPDNANPLSGELEKFRNGIVNALRSLITEVDQVLREEKNGK